MTSAVLIALVGFAYFAVECGVCGTGGVEVTELRDFGHLREGWNK